MEAKLERRSNTAPATRESVAWTRRSRVHAEAVTAEKHATRGTSADVPSFRLKHSLKSL